MNKLPDIFSLQREKEKLFKARQQVFDIVLKKCIEGILFTNKNNKTFFIFEVPKIIIGEPLYNYKVCLLYIIDKLKMKKYKVEFIEPNGLYIDWAESNSSLRKHTEELLKKFPNVSEIEYIIKK